MNWKDESFMDDNDIQADFMQVMEEDRLNESILQEVARGKMIPIYDHPLEQEQFLGCGKVIAGPEHVNGTGKEKIGFCKIRFYDSKEIAGHWININLIEGAKVDDRRSIKELETR